MPETFSVKSADGETDLYGVMWKPFDFDSTKNIPLFHVYILAHKPTTFH